MRNRAMLVLLAGLVAAFPVGLGVGALASELGLGWLAASDLVFGVAGSLWAVTGGIAVRALLRERAPGARVGNLWRKQIVTAGAMILGGLGLLVAVLLR